MALKAVKRKEKENEDEPTEKEMREYEQYCKQHPEYILLVVHRTGRVLYRDVFMDSEEISTHDFGGLCGRVSAAAERFENRGKRRRQRR